MVPHQPQSATWAIQSQHLLTNLVRSYVGKVHKPLVDVNSPPLGGQYTLWGQAPVTGGKPPYVAPSMVTQSATVGQPGWKQPSPLSQPPNWGQGVIQNPLSNVPNNTTSNLGYQQVPQTSP